MSQHSRPGDEPDLFRRRSAGRGSRGRWVSALVRVHSSGALHPADPAHVEEVQPAGGAEVG